MTSKAKRIGDEAERDVCALLADELGVPARRAFGAGRGLDEGDVVGIPDTVVQVVARRRSVDVLDAIRAKPLAAERQRANAHATHAATFLRLPGGILRVVLTPEQWCALWRATL